LEKSRDFGVKSLPLDDRPREKLVLKGPESLSDAELLAILLRTGMKGKTVIDVARSLLETHGNLAFLATKSLESLTKVDGIGKDKAAGLLAAFEISRRIAFRSKELNSFSISNPSDVGDLFVSLLRDETKEKFLVVCLNTANKIIKYEVITVGLIDECLVHPREVFKIAIDNNSKSIILIHNHPSGSLEPSAADISITRKLSESGKILEIRVLDHLIIGRNSFYSFKANNLI